MHLFCRSSTQTPPEVVKLLLPTSLYSIPARNKNKKKKKMTTRRKKHMYKSEKKCSLLQVAVARAAADKGRSAYHRTLYLSLNTFQYFPHSLTKLSNFCIIGWGNWRASNVLGALEVKEQLQKHRKRMSDSFLQLF